MNIGSLPKNRPLASIIILTCNQLKYTQQCVQSLLENTPRVFELIFVDNASRDGTVDFLRSLAGAKVIVNQLNKGYAAGCNQGLAVASGDILVLLNNDTIVTKDWLTGLLFHAWQDDSVGLLGPLSNYGAFSQGISVRLTSLREIHSFARNLRRQNFGRCLKSNFVSGMCMFIRREVVERIGGLDERFGYGNFEDDDFCLRAVLAGFKIYIALDVFIYHYGSRTFAGEKLDYSFLLAQNWILYKEKWGLPADFPPAERHTFMLLDKRQFSQANHFIPVKQDTGYI